MSEVQLTAPEAITLRIVSLRGQRVIVDADLAALYDVPTKRFNEAVKRKPGEVSGRFHVHAHCRGIRGFEVAICDLKRRKGVGRVVGAMHPGCLPSMER